MASIPVVFYVLQLLCTHTFPLSCSKFIVKIVPKELYFFSLQACSDFLFKKRKQKACRYTDIHTNSLPAISLLVDYRKTLKRCFPYQYDFFKLTFISFQKAHILEHAVHVICGSSFSKYFFLFFFKKNSV